MSLGLTPTQQSILGSTVQFCDETLAPNSIYRYLYDHAAKLFPDESFADLFQNIGRCSIPPQIVAVVMVLQRLEGLSDREAVDRFTYDMRWKYAAGGLEFTHPGFVHTVLVGMRERLRQSAAPNRVFDVVLQVAKQAGMVGRKRVLDSTPIYDAVATQDTVTLLRSGIRGVLKAAAGALEAELRGVLQRDDDYATAGKPACDWTDPEARLALVDALCRDAMAILAVVNEQALEPKLREAAALLATIIGQDIEETQDGRFAIARRVAKDRVISTVDPEARHGHKSKARSFDGYRGHISVDPDSEIITATAVSPGNTGDAAAAPELLAEVLPDAVSVQDTGSDDEDPDGSTGPATGGSCPPVGGTSDQAMAEPQGQEGGSDVPIEIYGDAAYGTAELVERVAGCGARPYLKVQQPCAQGGKLSKAAFSVDLEQGTVACPSGQMATIRRRADGSGLARFGAVCRDCALRDQCTTSKRGRLIQIHAKEAVLQVERSRQTCADWQEQYRKTRPKVERKLGHLVRRYCGGRRARVRGRRRIAQDFAMLAAARNLQRLAALNVAPGSRPTPAVDGLNGGARGASLAFQAQNGASHRRRGASAGACEAPRHQAVCRPYAFLSFRQAQYPSLQ